MRRARWGAVRSHEHRRRSRATTCAMLGRPASAAGLFARICVMQTCRPRAARHCAGPGGGWTSDQRRRRHPSGPVTPPQVILSTGGNSYAGPGGRRLSCRTSMSNGGLRCNSEPLRGPHGRPTAVRGYAQVVGRQTRSTRSKLLRACSSAAAPRELSVPVDGPARSGRLGLRWGRGGLLCVAADPDGHRAGAAGEGAEDECRRHA